MWDIPEDTNLDSKNINIMENRIGRGLLQIKVIKKTKPNQKKKDKKQMYSANLNWIQYFKNL